MSLPRVILMAFVAATLIHVASAIAGEATYYTTYVPSASYSYVDPGIMIAAVNEPLFDGEDGCGRACGRRYKIRCAGPTNQGVPRPCRNGEIMVKIIDLCPGCGPNQFNLSLEAFSRIADPAARRIRIEYNRS